MGRFLVVSTNLEYRFYRVGKDNRPMTVVKKRLYNTSEELYTADEAGSMEICPYPLESTQPMGDGSFLDPDITKAKLDVAKGANTQPTSKVGSILDNIAGKWVGILVLVLLGWAFIGSYMSGAL